MKTEMKNQSGFTLIELIMVIVILGILAATALPKFVNLGSDARTAAVKALEGSMRSTNAIIYGKAAVNNTMGASATTSVGAVTLVTHYGSASDVVELSKLMDTSSDFATSGTVAIKHQGATTPITCSVTYTAPTTAADVPVFTPTTSGC